MCRYVNDFYTVWHKICVCLSSKTIIIFTCLRCRCSCLWIHECWVSCVQSEGPVWTSLALSTTAEKASGFVYLCESALIPQRLVPKRRRLELAGRLRKTRSEGSGGNETQPHGTTTWPKQQCFDEHFQWFLFNKPQRLNVSSKGSMELNQWFISQLINLSYWSSNNTIKSEEKYQRKQQWNESTIKIKWSKTHAAKISRKRWVQTVSSPKVLKKHFIVCGRHLYLTKLNGSLKQK